HRRVSSPAARQENHGAAPTSCSGSKRRSLNSLKNCLDRWVHFTLMVRADTLDARSPRLRKRSDALATMDGRRIWRLTSMYTTILMIVLGVPAFSLLLHLLN
ncbi:hypothetical protein, partial [Pseudomonas aeruginosa]|uniref:hypothetical protein n=1 Tax=Pseudomonas aeruginosa TaxID=287 RepID=UPI00287FAB73